MIELEIRVAVVLNSHAPFDEQVHQCYHKCIHRSAPNAEVSFYQAAEGHYPDLNQQYHLIIIGGQDTTDAQYPKGWHDKMITFIKDVVANYPRTRLLGIGWGHHIICQAYGGKVAKLNKPVVGIAPTDLTLEGKVFINRACPPPDLLRQISFSPFLLHAFNTSYVVSIPQNFLLLAARYEMLECCESPVDGSVCQILTVAGHPEYSTELLKRMFMEHEQMVEDEELKRGFLESLEKGTREDVWWEAVMQWVITTRRRSSSGMKNPALAGLGIRGSATPSEDEIEREGGRSGSAIKSPSPEGPDEGASIGLHEGGGR